MNIYLEPQAKKVAYVANDFVSFVLKATPTMILPNSLRISGTLGTTDGSNDYDKKNITLSYKEKPIARFSSDIFGFSSDDILMFKEALLGKVESDDSFLKEVLSEQPLSKKTSLINSFPELSKYI